MKFSGKCLNPECNEPIDDKRKSYCSDACRPHAPCRRGGCPNLAVIGRNAGYCSFECKGIAKKERVKALAARQKASAKENAAAHYAVVKALEEGRLVRQPCEVCGSLKTDSHHPDYSKHLEVQWLCRKHHLLEYFRLKRATDPGT
jgi:hypothetical protein